MKFIFPEWFPMQRIPPNSQISIGFHATFSPDRMNGLLTGKLNKPKLKIKIDSSEVVMFEVHLKAGFFVLNKLIQNR